MKPTLLLSALLGAALSMGALPASAQREFHMRDDGSLEIRGNHNRRNDRYDRRDNTDHLRNGHYDNRRSDCDPRYNDNRYNDNRYDNRRHHDYGRYGYDRKGCDRNGYDRHGYDRYGYDRYGYDRNGYDYHHRYEGHSHHHHHHHHHHSAMRPSRWDHRFAADGYLPGYVGRVRYVNGYYGYLRGGEWYWYDTYFEPVYYYARPVRHFRKHALSPAARGAIGGAIAGAVIGGIISSVAY